MKTELTGLLLWAVLQGKERIREECFGMACVEAIVRTYPANLWINIEAQFGLGHSILEKAILGSLQVVEPERLIKFLEWTTSNALEQNQICWAMGAASDPSAYFDFLGFLTSLLILPISKDNKWPKRPCQLPVGLLVDKGFFLVDLHGQDRIGLAGYIRDKLRHRAETWTYDGWLDDIKPETSRLTGTVGELLHRTTMGYAYKCKAKVPCITEWREGHPYLPGDAVEAFKFWLHTLEIGAPLCITFSNKFRCQGWWLNGS
ncbi:hypothetical protein CDD81_7694 [Ophiocordyceps australis]|uniref:Uncharacterized protein n=1 Tax=Ophiocordyceps australis TaxID=1399860 RepID=A0A2C5XXG8_9HYPO|nr:hypothetical protein CDD81_7694 [Ophiocordyceps australis]